ncbi:hypothetical protein BBP40_010997 [Aspergillus hancockii]|nr:hypothetical protein BBP40_010997 [Aspergillus hancockii]
MDGWTLLHCFAGQLGDLSLFRAHVSRWDEVDAEGNTLLHLVVGKHRPGNETISELLKEGLCVNQRNFEGKCPIHMVDGPAEWIEDALDILLVADANLECKYNQGRTLLACIMQQREPGYQRGANINTQDYKGNGVLHYQRRHGKRGTEALEFLLSIGADPNLMNYEGNAILHCLAAAFALFRDESEIDIIRKLLYVGVSPTQVNFKVSGNNRAIDLVLSAGLIAALDIADKDGIRPIHLAASCSETLAARLIDLGADTTATTGDGRNLFHIAATARQTNIVGLLLEHYTSINQLSLCMSVRKTGHTVLLLLKHGADVNAESSNRIGRGKSPLNSCAEYPREERRWPVVSELPELDSKAMAARILLKDEKGPIYRSY